MNPTPGRIVRYTYRRDGELRTMPAMVTAVFEAKKDINPNPAGNPRARQLVAAVAVSLVVFDHAGSRCVEQAFEDTALVAGVPELGCWAWPEASRGAGDRRLDELEAKLDATIAAVLEERALRQAGEASPADPPATRTARVRRTAAKRK